MAPLCAMRTVGKLSFDADITRLKNPVRVPEHAPEVKLL